MNSKIIYNKNNKPLLFDKSFNISISHSNKFTSILLSKVKRVGIDVEYMTNRISRISSKFINNNEVITLVPDKVLYHLYIHWCAKEALYKISDKKNLSFKQNLVIQPFQLGKEGSIRGTIKNKLNPEHFDLNYFTQDNYVVVWCCKE